jgi:hypothetical protein
LLLPTSGSTGLLFVLLLLFLSDPRVLIFLSLSRFFVPWPDLSGKDFDIRAPYINTGRITVLGFIRSGYGTHRYGYETVTCGTVSCISGWTLL